MMDMFFPQDLQVDSFWYEAPSVNQSAFVAYADRPISEFEAGNSGSGRKFSNMNKRMIEFARNSWHPTIQSQAHEKERCFRHMMNERERRERQKQNYMSLHSMLPFGTKSDKNSIIRMAAKKIEELQRCAEELRRRNLQVQASLVLAEGERVGGAKIRLRVAEPASGVDYMLEVLKSLKAMGLKTRTIQSNFSAEEFSAELEIETEFGAAEVENEIQRALYEVERKLLHRLEEWRS